MANQKRLFLIDAYALIFRGYYAFIKNPRVNSRGMDTSAIFGFLNSLLDVIKRERPDYLAVCFDKGGSVARSEIFTSYKANREETPEAIKIAVPYIEKILEAMRIAIVVKEGFEADDIIGTLAKKAEKKGFETYMVTPDKDFAQLVSENIFIYKPPRMGNTYEKWGVEEVKAKFEVEKPEQVIDYLGMMGDAIDNIPGLPGVGDKTAKKFLKAYGSMEGLFAHIHELKGKMKEKIEANKELGLLSKQLARIIVDVPISFEEENFRMLKPDLEAVKKILKELEFKRLQENFIKTFGLSDTTPKFSEETSNNNPVQLDLFATQETATTEEDNEDFKTISNTEHFYQYIDSPLGIKMLLNLLLQQKEVCFDTETTGLNALQVEIVGIAFSWKKGTGYYIPFPKNQETTTKMLQELKPFFEEETIEKIGQNIKYDIKVLSNYGISVKGPLFDTMVAHYLIDANMRHNMDVLAQNYLNYKPVSITELIGKKGKNQLSMRKVPIAQQTEYAVEDADITMQLKYKFIKQLEDNNFLTLFKKIELPLIRVLSSMEIEGINVEVPFLKKLSKNLTVDIEKLEHTIYQQVGEKFNLASPKQLGSILFDKMKLVDKPKTTKTGQYATSEEVLSYLAKDHKIVADILEWRSYKKLQSTYVDALPNEVHPKTGRVHTVYQQTVVATGRLSSNHPNLQNIPIRTDRGREIRKAFIPRNNNYVLLAADYSQIELRIIAALSKEENMIQAFKKKMDIHANTAAKIYHIPVKEVTRTQRNHAKTVNFGIIYGVSAFGLSNQTELSVKESKALIENYYKTYPKLKEYMASQIEFARENGYVETVLGRKRYLRDIHSRNTIVRRAAERNAINAPIQGSAADIIKLAMIRLFDKMNKENYKSKMLLQVHDELVFDIYKPELQTLQNLIKTEMENAHPMAVPLEVEIGIGNNWLESH